MQLNQIQQIYNECVPYFIEQEIRQVPINARAGLVPLLLDSSSLRIFGCSKYYNSVESLMDHTTAERSSFIVNGSSKAVDLVVDSDKLWTVKFDKSEEMWKLDYNFLDEDDVKKHILVNQKLKCIDSINDGVCLQKSRITHRVPYEQILLIGKIDEVEKILSNNIVDDMYNDYPITSSYAKHKGVSLQEAATQLNFKIKDDFAYLAELESIRLKYTDIIVKTKNLESLKSIIFDFGNEMYGYSRFGIA